MTSHPLAVRAGIGILQHGGSAADAAIAASAVLTVVDPRSTGIGGDAFAMYWQHGGAPEGLDAAGPAPAGLSVDTLKEAGFTSMPSEGPWTVTVPGAVAGWDELMSRHGKLGLEVALRPAIDLASRGFSVTPRVAEEWATCVGKLQRQGGSYFLRAGRAPREGEAFSAPELSTTLRLIARDGAVPFYRGVIAEKIDDAVRRAGGPLTAADLTSWTGPRWVTPLSVAFRGLDLYELPPPCQGIVALQAVAIYDGMEVFEDVDREHVAIESIKLAFADSTARLADPDFEEVPVERLLDPSYIGTRRSLIDRKRASQADPGLISDTVYVATVDGDGSACSFIQSLYEGFGSGLVVPDMGIVLQNRGAGFILDDRHPNRPEPGKRPYHTIIPAMLGDDGGFRACVGVVGGFMQPQGQLQILKHVIEDRVDPQEAVNSPRWRFVRGREVAFEAAFEPSVVSELARRGHHAGHLNRFDAGGAQMIWRDGDRLLGASDPRKDGIVGVP